MILPIKTKVYGNVILLPWRLLGNALECDFNALKDAQPLLVFTCSFLFTICNSTPNIVSSLINIRSYYMYLFWHFRQVMIIWWHGIVLNLGELKIALAHLPCVIYMECSHWNLLINIDEIKQIWHAAQIVHSFQQYCSVFYVLFVHPDYWKVSYFCLVFQFPLGKPLSKTI